MGCSNGNGKSMKCALAILAVSCIGCASSPTAPAVPAAPPAAPAAVAKLTVKGDLDLEDIGTGWMMHALGVNSGDACAADIAGTSTIRSSTATFSYEWTSPAPLVKPGESFPYAFGPLLDADALKLGTAATYTTVFRFRSLPC